MRRNPLTSRVLIRKYIYSLLGLCYPITYNFIYRNDQFRFEHSLEGQHLLLSFDVDYSRDIDSIPELLKILKQLSVKSSFAIIGKHIETQPEVFNAIINDEHELLNHTYTHPDNKELSPDVTFTDLSDLEREEEIVKCQDMVRKYLGYNMIGFRLPHFGNVQTIDFHWLFNVLYQHNIKYDSSVLFPNFRKKHKTFFKYSPIIEIPVTTCPYHPYTALDSYHVYRSKRLVYNLHHFNDNWLDCLLKAKAKSDNINIPINVYLDPYDFLLKKQVFIEAIEKLKEYGVQTSTYSDYLKNIIKRREVI